MDKQTRFGIGATALGTLAGVLAPVITWWAAAPIIFICTIVAAWGFWPLFPAAPSFSSLLRRRILIHEAARRAYEAAERAGVLDLVTSPESEPEVRLKYFLYVFLVDDDVVLWGVKPPSTKALPIPRGEYSALHPVVGESRLDYLTPARIAYTNVTIHRRDLRRIIREFPPKAKEFARRNQRP